MKNHSAESTETILAETTPVASQLHAEIDEMRRRLAALETRAPADANQTVGRKRHWRATPKRLALMIAGVVLAGATIVFGQSAVESLFVSKDGKVGIGTNAPSAKLDVAGSGWFRNDQGGLPGTAGKGVRVFYDTNDTGSIFSYDYSTSKSQNLILQSPGGNVGIGNITPQAKLHVAGTLIYQGRYQRDDSLETTYEISPRYHVSLTAARYDGSTRQIPQQVINDLCGDPDGCQFRLGMTRWSLDSDTETASLTGLFYYSMRDGHWRTSMLAQRGLEASPGEAIGVDGNKKTDHVGNAWNTCFFTDSPYSKYQDQSDPTIGMYLLVWKEEDKAKYNNPGRTCELTLID